MMNDPMRPQRPRLEERSRLLAGVGIGRSTDDDYDDGDQRHFLCYLTGCLCLTKKSIRTRALPC